MPVGRPSGLSLQRRRKNKIQAVDEYQEEDQVALGAGCWRNPEPPIGSIKNGCIMLYLYPLLKLTYPKNNGWKLEDEISL